MKYLKTYKKLNETVVSNLDDVFYVGTKEEAKEILDEILNAETIDDLYTIDYMDDVVNSFDINKYSIEEIMQIIKENAINIFNREF